jgi:hypothetical protein
MSQKKQALPKGERIFQIVSLIIIDLAAVLVCVRLYTVKDIMSGQPDTADTLYDLLVHESMTDVDNVLVQGETYLYHDQPAHGCVRYEGQLYRVLEIDADHVVRMVLDRPVTVMALPKGTSWQDSALYTWLNRTEGDEFSGLGEQALASGQAALQPLRLCDDIIDDIDQIGCAISSEAMTVGLLTLNDYEVTGGSGGFLNNGTSYWLASRTMAKEHWLVRADGSVTLAEASNLLYGVRPVIAVAGSLAVSAGQGTAQDPWVIGTASASTLADVPALSYVSYSGQLWQVAGSGENGVPLIRTEVLKDSNGDPQTFAFGDSAVYSASSGLGGYLNSTYLESLDNWQQLLVEEVWSYGAWDTAGFDYHDSVQSAYQAYVSIPGAALPLGETTAGIFLNQIDTTGTLVYRITAEGFLFADQPSSGGYVRPVISMKSSVGITGGDGSRDNPYVIGEMAS